MLLRMMRIAGASPQHLRYAKVWVCEVCRRRQAPLLRRVASARPRPSRFGAVVAVDLKEVSDCTGRRCHALNILDVCMRYSMLVLVPNVESNTQAYVLFTRWAAWVGQPGMLIC